MQAIGHTGVASTAVASSNNVPFDLESALASVQMGRVKNMDEQLQAQIEGIQANNAKATKLNEAMKLINSIVDKFGSETDPNKHRDIGPEETKALESALTDLGINRTALFGSGFTTPRYDEVSLFSYRKVEGYSNVSLSNFKTASATIKGQIDTNSNTQQMDMLRLQSLTNKRNEAFETMSSVMKKIQDANSSILNRV